MTKRVVRFDTAHQEIWIEHFSVITWDSRELWDEYLRGIEEILGDRLARLDDHDPIRRKANTAGSEGAFVVDFDEREEARWVWGRFEKTKALLSASFSRSPVDLRGHHLSSMLKLSLPEHLGSAANAEVLVDIFHLGNRLLQPYYAACDFSEIMRLIAFSVSAGHVQHERELNGIFWLTYFNSRYVDFFGRDRLANLFCAARGPRDGVELRLAASPAESSKRDAIELQQLLGANSFASRRGPGPPKEIGEYVLTYKQLHAGLAHEQGRESPQVT